MDLDPGWKPDPTRRYPERYWDGQGWSDRVRDGGNETSDRFEVAMQTPLTGEAKPPDLFERPIVRLLIGALVLAGLALLLLGPIRGLLDGVPGTAREAPATSDGLVATAEDLAEAASDGRWTIVTAFYPDDVVEDDELSTRVATVLRACFGDTLGGTTVASADQVATLDAGGTNAVELALIPRPEVLPSADTLVVRLRHDGTRWVVVDPIDGAGREDGSTVSCTGRAG